MRDIDLLQDRRALCSDGSGRSMLRPDEQGRD
jgi:hypothetical protein